jgi:hypothetical protein
MYGGITLQIGMKEAYVFWSAAAAGQNAILRDFYAPNDHRTDANDELRLVALPMIVC